MAFSPSPAFSSARYLFVIRDEQTLEPVLKLWCETIADVRGRIAFNAKTLTARGGVLYENRVNDVGAFNLTRESVVSHAQRYGRRLACSVVYADGRKLTINVIPLK